MRWYRSNFPLVGMVVVCFLLAACGPSDELAQPELAPTTVRWAAWETDNPAESLLVGQFQEEFPQITFERRASFETLAFMANSVSPPDLVNADVNWDFAQLSQSGKIADLSELWEESGLTENVPASLQQVSAYQDRQFYIPVGVGWKAIYYNKQIFADYNLSPPESWEDFLAICDTLLANGEVPLSISGVDAWAMHGWFEYLNLRMNGIEFHQGLLTGKERYDDPRVRHVMETWQSLFANGYFIEQRATVAELISLTALVRSDNGKLDGPRAVMVLATTYAHSNLPAPFQSELDFFRFPIFDPSIPIAEVVQPFGYALPMGADHMQASMLFMEYLSSIRAQQLAAQAPLFMSALYAPVRGDVNGEGLTADQRKGLTLISEASATALYYEYALPAQMEYVVDTYFRAFVKDPTDIDFFIFHVEEIRQQMVDRGILVPE